MNDFTCACSGASQPDVDWCDRCRPHPLPSLPVYLSTQYARLEAKLEALVVRGQRVPRVSAAAIAAYVVYRRPLGHCLTAVAEDSIGGFLARADSEHMDSLAALHAAFYWEAPSQCWGSRAKVTAWLDAAPASTSGAGLDAP